MKKSIFSKIFFSFSTIILSLSSFILILTNKIIKEYYIGNLEISLKKITISLEPEIKDFLVNNQPYTVFDSFAKKIGNEINTRITIISADGTVLGDSKKNPLKMENHLNRPEIQEALKKGFGKSMRFSTTVEEKMLYVAKKIVINKKTVCFVRASLFLKDINTLLGKLKKRILFIIFLTMIFSLIGAYFFSLNFSKPIKLFHEFSVKIASGDFSKRIPLKRKDEIGLLVKSFNEMTEKLERLFSELKAEKEKILGIVSSLKEGFALINKDEKIIIYNESFKKIFKIDNPIGKHYWEIFKNQELSLTIENVFKEKKSVSKEFELNENFYILSTTYLKSSNEIIIVIHDISEFKKLEKMKKDLITNVSHELRTPLTSIKGYIETIEETIDEKSKKFIEIIKRNTERLINIVEDLLTLSELEEKKELRTKKTSLYELIENVFCMFKEKALSKGIALINNVPENFYFYCDPFRIEQMIINLIDNAIKYTEKGYVKVSSEKKDKGVIIKVRDTGIGIPEKDIKRIFERFYVVDKSRSRRMGGTGLGLSIVKHIVLLHKGKITVKSKPGEGTEFTITFPQI